LQDRINRLGPLEVDEIVRGGLQTARGLAAAHRQGVIHRDVKPGNLMLSSTSDPPIVKITDFGLARAIDDSNLTHHGTVIGTPEYMSPEQARGETVDPRSDLFSLGSVLYAMATGSSPFRADSAMAVLRRVCDETPTPVRAINPRIPEWLATLIGRLLAKNRDDRIATAAEVADLLQGYLAHLQNAAPAPALGPAPVQSEAAVRVKRIRARGVVLLSASILLAAIFAVLLLRNSPALHANDWRVVAVGLGGLFCLLALGMIVFLLRWKPADPLQSVRPAGRAFTESAKVFMDLQCPGCQKAFKVQAAYRGNSVKCPSCGAPTSLKNESQTDTDRHR
jgi:serine/threonine-protein kinase